MQNGNLSPADAHTLTLTGRSIATITGVEDVDCFNEQIVILRTPLGALTLSGDGLNISQLNLEEGQLDVTGKITGVEYNGPIIKKEKRGLFAHKRR